jgi:ferredoxin
MSGIGFLLGPDAGLDSFVAILPVILCRLGICSMCHVQLTMSLTQTIQGQDGASIKHQGTGEIRIHLGDWALRSATAHCST